MAVDPAASQSLFDALKDFVSSGADAHHSALYNSLKDFQTLAAAFVAFAAAWVAYLSAMVSARNARRTELLADASKRLGLLVRLNAAANSVATGAQAVRPIIPRSVDTSPVHDPVREEVWLALKANMHLVVAPDFAEAWKRIELIPRDAVDDLRSLMGASGNLPAIMKTSTPENRTLWLAKIELDGILISAPRLSERLQPVITKLSRYVSKNTV